MLKITMTGHAKLKIQWAHCSLWLRRWVIQSENPRGTRHSKPFRPFQLVVHWRGCHSAAQWPPCERGLSLASENLALAVELRDMLSGVGSNVLKATDWYWHTENQRLLTGTGTLKISVYSKHEPLWFAWRNWETKKLEAAYSWCILCVCVWFDGIRQGITQK